jgi:hypothetical protein
VLPEEIGAEGPEKRMLAMARMSHDWSSGGLEGRDYEREGEEKVSFGWVIAANVALWASIAVIAVIVL